MQTKLLNPAWWDFLPAPTAAFKREALKRVRQTLDCRELARFSILRRVAVTTTFSLLLVGNLEAIDWELRPVGRYVPGGEVRGLVIAGNHAYAVGGDSGPPGLRVFDLSNATEPALVGHSHNNRRTLDVAVASEYAYVVGDGSLEVFHLGNPASPELLGICDIPGGSDFGVAVSGRYAYVASGHAGLVVVDVSKQANPRQMGRYDTTGFAYAVAVSGDYAYLIEHRSSSAGASLGGFLWVIDIRNPTRPQRVGTYAFDGPIYTLAVSGAYAYLSQDEVRDSAGQLLVSAGLRVIDLRDPANPRLAGRYDSSHPLGGVVVSGGFAYTAQHSAGLTVIDISNPADPRPMGEYAIKNSTWAVAVSSDHAYVGTRAGFEVINITTPASPRRVGGYGTGPFVHGLVASGAYGYAIESGSGFKPSSTESGGRSDQLRVIDFSNPAKPKPRGVYHSSGRINGLVVSGNYAYLAEGSRWEETETNEFPSSLRVIDVADPANPREVGMSEPGWSFPGVAVSGNYAYVASYGGTIDPPGLMVIDISDPANPQTVTLYPTGGRALAVVVSGHYAYVAGDRAGFDVIDISNPARPRRVSTYEMGESFRDFAVSGNYAFVSSDRGLEVFDIRDPANLQLITTANDRGGFLAVSGEHLFSSTGSGLELIDLTSLGLPPGLRAFASSGSSGHVAVSGGNVFVTWVTRGGSELQVFAPVPANPQRVGEEALPDTQYTAVAVSGNVAYTAVSETYGGGLQVVDISDPAKPQRVGRYKPDGGGPNDVAVSGHYAYLAETPYSKTGQGSVGGGLRVIDVADPANPREVGRANSGYSFRGVAVSGNYAYVASDRGAIGSGGLRVIDISDPANPWSAKIYKPGVSAVDVVISDRYAYVTDGDAGFDVIDINDPLNPKRLGRYGASFNSDGWIYDIVVADNYAYVAVKSPDGLQVIDISDPANPRLVGRYDTAVFAAAVAVSGNYAYVRHDSKLFEVIDVSNPTQLRRVGGNRSLSVVDDMVVAGGRLVATGWSPSARGLIILDLFRSLRLESLPKSEPGAFRLRVDGPRGVSARIQRSTNLTNWEDWQPITLGAAPTEISDPDAGTASPRFYRGIIR